MSDLQIGDCVMFAETGGSYGKVEVVETTWKEKRYRVIWIYGKDRDGKFITSISPYKKRSELLKLPHPEWADEFFNAPAWSGEQKVISAKILKDLQA